MTNIGNILLIKNNEKIIGMVNILYSVSTVLGGKAAILEDMVIKKQYIIWRCK